MSSGSWANIARERVSAQLEVYAGSPHPGSPQTALAFE
jgi:hypothetical protein